MNSPLVIREARSLALGILKQESTGKRRMEELYLRVLDRRPDGREVDQGLSYVQNLRQK